MRGVIVVDAGRSWSTNLGRDAYIMIIPWISSWLFEFCKLPNSNCFPTVCYFPREKPLAKPMAPGSLFIIFAFTIYFPLHLFSDLLNQKYKRPWCNLFVPRSIYPIYHFYLMLFAYLEAPYPKGIDNPSCTSGCKDLFFVCRYRSRSVVWFSY